MSRFECDKKKARINFEKHHVRFTEAARAFSAGYSLTELSPQSALQGEERYLSIVRLLNGRAIVLVWTPRHGNVRIISVRAARSKEKEALNAYLQRLQ